MTSRRPGRRRSASAVLGALVCLFALQSLFAYARSARAPGYHASASLTTANDEICRSDSAPDRGAPLRDRHGADQCRLACAPGGRDDAPAPLLIVAIVDELLTPSTSGEAADRRVDAIGRRFAVGRRAHSSRAPPRLA